MMACNNKLKALATVAGLVGLMAPLASHAVVALPISTYHFSGNCTDCAAVAGASAFPIVATLELLGHAAGDDLSLDHFFRFTYGGSNLIDPYVVAATFVSIDPIPGSYEPLSIAGNVDGAAGAQTLSLRFMTAPTVIDDDHVIPGIELGFELSSTGAWFTCGARGGIVNAVPCSWNQNSDTGQAGVFTAASVPEPATHGLMALGLAGLGLRRRRA